VPLQLAPSSSNCSTSSTASDKLAKQCPTKNYLSAQQVLSLLCILLLEGSTTYKTLTVTHGFNVAMHLDINIPSLYLAYGIGRLLPEQC